ncbi:TPA: acyl-CoA dehydrogenase family protein [Acinetobacter baumannii]|uniref:acyl-CoA dehydrogenase family protein n=1 Tax=Acinetobacter baumannii TaxID=470 RepID=UPI00157FD191|nr:acyl-CoA dehydrogenase family protein [Acinetobacter baumannii]MDC5001854.1 acyl-CoA/acyl-ACP dehydrogenase [Acinetobacter baumannii]MDC5214971.1 acyl-CoA/acyl-ACP dehydrogenase [Acinetobacter baumannii]NUG30860.1 acyl-CoA dehydrogenase family protein [Acinetobacter baumannii]HEN9518920.1 acyl-CoA dehydrogenase family protein [Acinetobacter baumannii]
MSKLMIEDSDGILTMLEESVRGFAQQYPGVLGLRQIRQAQGVQNRQQWQAMVEAGWVGLLLPESLGGAGLSLREQVVISHTLGEELIVSPIATVSVQNSVLLAQLEASAERDRLACGLANGTTFIVSCLNQTLKADFQSNSIIITGMCEHLDAVSLATDFVVLAHDESQQYLISLPAEKLVELRQDRPAVDGTCLSALHFDCFTISPDRILAMGDLDHLCQTALNAARLAVSAELAGLASKAFSLTSEYTQQRIQFGKPIASFQAIQHRLVDMWTQVEFACATIENAIEALTLDDESKAYLAILAAKIRCSDAATTISRQAIHLFGAMGFTDECDIGLYLKRSINLAASLGEAEKLRLKFIEMERAA